MRLPNLRRPSSFRAPRRPIGGLNSPSALGGVFRSVPRPDEALVGPPLSPAVGPRALDTPLAQSMHCKLEVQVR